MQNPLYLILLLGISSVIVFIDQYVKFTMIGLLSSVPTIPVVKGLFSLTLVFNTGAAFGMLRDKRYIFLILPVLTTTIILFIFFKSKVNKSLIFPFAFLLGGTIGNFIDRVQYGYVVDFFDVFYKKWHWPVFNIADSCICVGVFLLLIQLIKSERTKQL